MHRRAGIFEKRGVVALGTTPYGTILRAIVPSACDALETSLGFPHYADGISKRNFISTVSPTVHTNPFRKRSF